MRSWIEPLQRPHAWWLMAANALPLLGVVSLGWDAATLVLFYWLETAVIGFWTCVRVALTRRDGLDGVRSLAGDPAGALGGIGLALFLLAHAGIFMGVHLFILDGVMPGAWQHHLDSPIAFVTGFIVPSGLWIPLAGLFAVGGLITLTELRQGLAAGRAVVAFYLRIVIMQSIILLGGMAAMLLGGMTLLLLLVVAKTVVDLYLPAVHAYVAPYLAKARNAGGDAAPD